MAAIGDLIIRILAQMDGFEASVVKGAEKAGDAAGKTLGQRMSAGIKQNGAKILGTGLALGFGIATKGLLELEKVQADFAAETGATADEANRAGKAINEMSGRNIQPLAEIGATLTKVHTDLGLTGDEAEHVAESFLKFGRATKQDAAEAVKKFDDILDAWGLTAADATQIMDKLIVSHQRYGGSIDANEASLAALAPALKAANLTVDDGIGLLNLFEASNVDSAVAVTGMTKALTKVKSPEELKRLVADIIATEDPFLRAQKASALFGAKAGAKLANALKPGAAGLEDYTVSLEDSAGATQKAADVLDSTFGARFQLLLKGATSKLVEFGGSFGPVLTGMASIASLGGAKFGGALIGMLQGGWTKAAALAGGKAATAYLTALMAADRIKGALAPATDKLGTALGTRLGKTLSLAFAAVAVVEVINTYNDIKTELDAMSADIGKSIGEELANGTVDQLRVSRAAVLKALQDLVAVPGSSLLFSDQIKALQEQGRALDAEIAKRGTATTKALGTTARHVKESTGAVSGDFFDVGAASDRMTDTIKTGVAKINAYIHGLAVNLATEARAMISGYYDPIIAQEELLVEKDAVAAASRERNATKAGTAERHQAQLTLDQSRSALEQTRTNLLEAGKLSAKEQKTWLTELQAKYKSATGDARVKLGLLIAKIKELQGAQGGGITITVRGLGATHSGKGKPGGSPGHNAAGGIIPAGGFSWTGERGRELIGPVPSASLVIPHVQSEALVAGGGDTYQTVLNMPVREASDPFETANQLRRLADFGVLRAKKA